MSGVLLIIALLGLLAWHRRRSRKRKEGQQPADKNDIHDSPASLGAEASMHPPRNSDDLTTKFKRCIGAAVGPSAPVSSETLTPCVSSSRQFSNLSLWAERMPGAMEGDIQSNMRWQGGGTPLESTVVHSDCGSAETKELDADYHLNTDICPITVQDPVHHILTLTRAHETAVADTSIFLLSHLTARKVFKAKYEAEGRRWRGTGTMFLTATQFRPCNRK